MRRAYCLTRGDLLRIANGDGTLLSVHEGELWLTQEGDRRDRYLGPGDSFQLDRAGLAIASALQRSLVSLTGASP
jgi:Protein of unknown function (DUF2917)